jgi:glycerophosphoryl diester phosphodiesterase
MNNWLDSIKVIAHRGDSFHHIENTQSAIDSAIKKGADMIEIDIRATKDKELVIFHDLTLLRLARKHWSISRSSLTQLKAVKLSKGESILTLAEALQLIKGKCKLNLEIKIEGYEEKILTCIKEYQMEEEIIISSKKISVLKQFKTLAPDIPRAFVINYAHLRKKTAILAAKELGVEAIHPINLLSTKDLIQFIHDQGLKARPYPINSTSRANQLLRLGVTSMFTDKPELLKKVFHDHGTSN